MVHCAACQRIEDGCVCLYRKLNDDYTVVNDETGEETIYNTNMKRNRMALSTCYQTHRLTCRGGNICGEKMVVSTAEFFML